MEKDRSSSRQRLKERSLSRTPKQVSRREAVPKRNLSRSKSGSRAVTKTHKFMNKIKEGQEPSHASVLIDDTHFENQPQNKQVKGQKKNI